MALIHHRYSSRPVIDRYQLEVAILGDGSLASWFLDVCMVDTPSTEPSEELTAKFEDMGLVVRSGGGWILGPEGKRLAEDLGIVMAPDSGVRADAEASEQIDHAWTAYRRTRSTIFRNHLIEHYLPLVRAQSDRLLLKMPKGVNPDGLMTAGILSLMEDVEEFAGSSADFSKRAIQNVRVAMLNELRQLDWIPKLARRRSSKVQATIDQLQTEFRRVPTIEEVATRLRVTNTQLREMVKDARAVSFLEEPPAVTSLDGGRKHSPIAERHRTELRRLLTQELSRDERLIVVLYYFEELTVPEIAAVLDLTAKTVANLHESILWRLRTAMQTLPSILNPIAK